MASVKVAVRVRPFNQREKDMNDRCVIQMRDKTTGIEKAPSKYQEFTFDHSYWSHDPSAANYTSQEIVYNDLGREVVDCAYGGYNACVFAYGQTGSGKTYTMMGTKQEPGLIPRICQALFDRMADDAGKRYRVDVSYMEIYNEAANDLLNPKNKRMKVREGKDTGPYLPSLTLVHVKKYEDIKECIEKGNLSRQTAATKMNDQSSRSHAIFTIHFVQANFREEELGETVSKIHLVDLAGSERASATEATDERLKEGSHINKSLVTLGTVISTLAENSLNKKGKLMYVPYRNSLITWLLKDSLGGNSKTYMIAAISPAFCNCSETLSTLRYANRAKNIMTTPQVNVDAHVELIKQLRAEIFKLKTIMDKERRAEVNVVIQEKEHMEKQLTEKWTGKWAEAHRILQSQRELALRTSGKAVVLDSELPHLVSLNSSPFDTGVLLFHLHEGETSIGSAEVYEESIVLQGVDINPHHCTCISENGVVTIHPINDAYVAINNNQIDAPVRLSQGMMILIGRYHLLRFNHPGEAAKLRNEEHNNLPLTDMATLSSSSLNLSELFVEKRKSLIHEKEILLKEQEDFEQKRRHFEEAQAQLASEKRLMEQEHAAQVRELQENWKSLTEQQKRREEELFQREQELVAHRKQLERQRNEIFGDIQSECMNVNHMKSLMYKRLHNFCRLVSDHCNEVAFPDGASKDAFQELVARSDTYSSLSDSESDYLVELLNGIKGQAALEDLVNKHRKELAELQSELERRVAALNERKLAVERLDEKLVSLVDEQLGLGVTSDEENLQALKTALASRTQQQLKELEAKKQALSLNLRRINSAQSPIDSLQTNYTSSLEEAPTSSSDTYHTAPASASSIDFYPDLASKTYDTAFKLMSDSGVELRPPSSRVHEESDLSSNEEGRGVTSDSQSTSSSIENRSPVRRKRNDLTSRIENQKLRIMTMISTNRPQAEILTQLSILQDLQNKFKVSDAAQMHSIRSPTLEHPLQDLENTPSPIRPVNVGSTSDLYSSTLSIRAYHPSLLYRSMPSIMLDPEAESKVVSIRGYCVRGAGASTHYEYDILIITSDDRWSIMRRFNRFRDLHLAMCKRYGEKMRALKFPARTWFRNNEKTAQTRKKTLEVYLRELIEVAKTHPECPLAYSETITRTALCQFSVFFQKGMFESGKHLTS